MPITRQDVLDDIASKITDKVAAGIGRDDEALQALLEDQEKDYEPSPLSEKGRNPIVRPSL